MQQRNVCSLTSREIQKVASQAGELHDCNNTDLESLGRMKVRKKNQKMPFLLFKEEKEIDTIMVVWYTITNFEIIFEPLFSFI